MKDGSSNSSPADFTRAINGLAPSDYPGEVQDEIQHELRRLAEMHMARERPGHTLQCTALLNEAYMWFLSSVDGEAHYPSRGHFYALASRIMRNVLAGHARKRNTKKRGGDWERMTLVVGRPSTPGGHEPEAPSLSPCSSADISADLLDLSEALEELEGMRSDLAQVVDMRFFGGMEVPAMAEALGMGQRTVERRLRTATAWLVDRLGGDTGEAGA